MSRINSLDALQPIARERADDMLSMFGKEGLRDLQVYETGRSPWRQAQLFARGRLVGKDGKTIGTKATKSKAWRSDHQFLLALDCVFYVDGAWTWDEPEAGMWDLYHNIARRCQLSPLDFEKPHVAVAWSDHALQSGRMPPNFDGSYAHKLLDEWSERWGPAERLESGLWHPGAPPIPDINHRPELVT